jgi:leucyl aminopeptidase
MSQAVLVPPTFDPAPSGAVIDAVQKLPRERRHRADIESSIADLQNLGGPNAGAITAALFLAEFVDGIPWAHVDIAGVADVDKPGSWRPAGCGGFGARLLVELALGFAA